MAQSSFAFDESNIHNIRFKMLHLVKWGFPYSDLRNIPLDEVDEYIILINDYYEKKNRQATDTPSVPDDPKTIGQINKTAF